MVIPDVPHPAVWIDVLLSVLLFEIFVFIFGKVGLRRERERDKDHSINDCNSWS